MSSLSIIIANMGISFDSCTVGRQPLGGVESATVELAEALSRRGHNVCVYNNRATDLSYNGVNWKPLKDGMPLRADLYIANRHHELLFRVPLAKQRALWLHNPVWEIDNWMFRSKMALLRPKVIVLGEYHRQTCPPWVQKYDVVTIPLGLSDSFLIDRPTPQQHSRRAIFTSNPGRNLDWLLQVWSQLIHPQVPDAELHLFSGPQVYQQKPGNGLDQMKRVLAAADALVDRGIVRHDPIGRDRLIDWIASSRIMLYRGHQDETFCLALAEAQALGVPCIVQPIGSVVERVRDAVTGFIAADEHSFALHAIKLLTDDALHMRMHQAAKASQRARTWDAVALDFERLVT
jgi:glycosyltransferase involved in cell wall biosynthesis